MPSAASSWASSSSFNKSGPWDRPIGLTIGLRIGSDADLRRRVARRADRRCRSPVSQIESFADELHPIALRFVERFEAAGEDEVVGGAGAGDVQHAFAFFEFFAPFEGGVERHAGGDFFVFIVGRLRHERAEVGVQCG